MKAHPFPSKLVAALAVGVGCGGNNAPGPSMQSTQVPPPFGYVLVGDTAANPDIRTVISAGYDIPHCKTAIVSTDCFMFQPCADETRASAGTLTVTGMTSAMLTPGQDSSYKADALPNQFVDSGQTIQFSAAGAEVPAHMGTVIMPPALQVVTPNPSEPQVIERNSDLALVWAPSTSSQVQAFLGVFAPSGGTALGSIGCSFHDVDGGGTIPASLLQQLPTMEAGSFSSFSIGRYNWSNTTVGEWHISFGASSNVSFNATLH